MVSLKETNVPLYLQIEEVIKSRISKGIYPVNSLIPGELDLAKEFNVSRVSIRAALSLLAKDGYIKRRAGQGTYVRLSDPNLNKFTSLKSFTSEMKENGQKSITLNASLEIIPASEELAHIFSVPVSTELYLFKRIRGNENVPIVYSYTYLHVAITIPQSKAFLYGSLYSFLIDHGISFATFQETIQAEMPTKDVINALELKSNQAVLKRIRSSFDKTHQLIEYTINYYNAIHYKYSIEIKQ